MSAIIHLADYQAQPQPEVKERRVADVDEGYTRIANELLDALVEADLTKHQYKVMLAMMRKTYGFNKSFDRITNTQIAEMVKLPHTRVCTAKNELLDMKILIMDGRKIGVNKVISDWVFKVPRNRETFPETGRETFPETGNTDSPKQGNTKDTIQKTKDIKISSSEIADAITDAPVNHSLAVVDANAKVRPEAAIQTPSGQKWGNADDLKAAEWIHARAVITNPTLKKPNWPAWANEVRLMREADQRTHREICELYDWVSKDAFWCANVLSPATLRKQWDKLAAKRLNGGPARRESEKDYWDRANNDQSWADDLGI